MSLDNGLKVYDAHMHINFKAQDPLLDLENYIKDNKISKGILILNTYKEFTFFSECILKNIFLRDKFIIVIGLNKNENFILEGKKLCNEIGQKLYIKLHPRLFKIKEKEVNWYIEQIEYHNPKVIIIDDFLYGNDVKKDFTISLICLLAEKFKNKKIIMAHAGGVQMLEHVMRAKGLNNIYFDISLTCNYLYKSSIYYDLCWLLKYSRKKVLAGSDYPDFTLNQVKNSIIDITKNNEMMDVPIENFFYQNIFEVFGEEVTRC